MDQDQGISASRKRPMLVESPPATDTFMAQLCRFKRDEKSLWEWGVLIGEDQIIIDRHYKPVPAPLWNYEPAPHVGGVALFHIPEADNV
jgi:hypothetical protein